MPTFLLFYCLLLLAARPCECANEPAVEPAAREARRNDAGGGVRHSVEEEIACALFLGIIFTFSLLAGSFWMAHLL